MFECRREVFVLGEWELDHLEMFMLERCIAFLKDVSPRIKLEWDG